MADPDPIPHFSSADLHIASWERLDHGGHSFVFKVSINDALSVVKIFRLQPTSASPDPYLYFTRELGSHQRLVAAGLAGTHTPRIHGVLRISPAHEALLLSEGKLPPMRRRRKVADRPLMAVWMELIPGRRLAVVDMAGEAGRALRLQVEGALEKVHAAGVLQGDVKWRNIMVADGRAVWLDFSNAGVVEAGTAGGAAEEMEKLRWMLGRYERVQGGIV
ncbi:hypothetical protein Q9L58_009827 [Maublancomyces gigas]|uniref:Protein kinase domain-containing protein n=1 Tax=Discina gigas TaxID=1032678 RepID=A0ABR3G5U4_9PEZI